MEQVPHVMILQLLGLCKWLQMLSFLVFITLEGLPVTSRKQDQCVQEVRSSVPDRGLRGSLYLSSFLMLGYSDEDDVP